MDASLSRSVTTFTEAFFAALERASDVRPFKEALDKALLLHAGGFFRLPPARFEQCVGSLVALFGDQPKVALSYARFCPANERCAALLQSHGEGEAESLPRVRADGLQVTARPSLKRMPVSASSAHDKKRLSSSPSEKYCPRILSTQTSHSIASSTTNASKTNSPDRNAGISSTPSSTAWSSINTKTSGHASSSSSTVGSTTRKKPVPVTE